MAAVLAVPTAAAAWSQYETSQGHPLRWAPRTLNSGISWSVGVTDLEAAGLTAGQLQQASEQAFAAWQQGPCDTCVAAAPADCTRDCSAQPTTLALAKPTLRPSVGFGLSCTAHAADGQCVDAEPNGNQVLVVHNRERWHYGSSVVAMTLVSARPGDGWIADADIALNTGWYDFCVADCGPLQPALQAILLHEAGHFFGLDHSLDKQAAMWAHADVLGGPGLKLQSDDLQGICAIYGGEPATCEPGPAPPPAEGGGCSAGQGGAAPHIALLLAFALGLCRWRSVAGGRPRRPGRGNLSLGGVA